MNKKNMLSINGYGIAFVFFIIVLTGCTAKDETANTETFKVQQELPPQVPNVNTVSPPKLPGGGVFTNTPVAVP